MLSSCTQEAHKWRRLSASETLRPADKGACADGSLRGSLAAGGERRSVLSSVGSQVLTARGAAE
eukprot:4862280-Pyramimonas_sp.AAC.1